MYDNVHPNMYVCSLTVRHCRLPSFTTATYLLYLNKRRICLTLVYVQINHTSESYTYLSNRISIVRMEIRLLKYVYDSDA